MSDILAQLTPYIVTLLIAGIGTLISLLGVAKLRMRVKSLESYFADDEVNDYFIVCPNCHHKVILNRVKIYAQLKEVTKAEEELAKLDESQKEDN